MPQQNRVSLKSYFLTGSKPTQLQFADLVDSVTNIKEDGVSSDGAGNTIFTQGITIKNSSIDTVGSIRWNGTNFQFRDNTGWQNLNLSGGGGSQWTTAGANINYAAGNVGIGVPAPAYKLEVTLNNSAGTVNQVDTVRLGSLAIFNDAFNTYISHRNMAALNSYALAQDGSGNVIINSATGRTISFFEGGTMRANFQAGVFNIGTSPGNAATNLMNVFGNASKPGGGSWGATSDRRVKTGISPFNDGLDLLKKLDPVNYQYNGKANTGSGTNFVGLIAQDVQEIFPYMVSSCKGRLEPTDAQETDILSLDVSALTYVMVNSLKELDSRLARLEILQHATLEA